MPKVGLQCVIMVFLIILADFFVEVFCFIKHFHAQLVFFRILIYESVDLSMNKVIKPWGQVLPI